MLDLNNFEYPLFGARAGYFDKWGFTARYTAGSITDDLVEGTEGMPTKTPLFNSSIDLGLIPHFRRFLLHFDFTLSPYFNFNDNFTLKEIFFSTGAGYSF